MRVAIVGAGGSGLASAKNVIAEGMDCQVLEMRSELGGTWAYCDDVEEDQYGFPVYSPMYKNLTTNLPKEMMGFPDYPVPDHGKSYISQAELLEFLNQYADHFKIREAIKFNRMVTEIRPFESKWQIKSVDKPTREETVEVYDAVMICNGQYNDPVVPKLPGQELFKGPIRHSQQLRTTDPFRDRRVLVVGGGPSGLDVALHASHVAPYVVLSHHTEMAANTKLPSHVFKKPDILRIKGAEEIEFVDGSCASFDTICLCTGYNISFPFLHDSCGVTVKDNLVQPLYKQMIHTEKPTMCFIGLPIYGCPFHLFDLQARFFCKYLKGALTLPSSKAMQMDTEAYMRKHLEGEGKKKPHYLGENQQSYYDELAAIANIPSIKPVYVKLWAEGVKGICTDFQNYRSANYKIINDETFIRIQ